MIEVRHLVKTFPEVKAVDDISFEVGNGEIFGIIGPNGAGKTTCLNILATLLQPTEGEILIDGLEIFENAREVRRKIGYMPDFFGTYRNLTIEEYLDFYGGCCGVPLEARIKRIDEVIELTTLHDKRKELVDNLSRGMKQRLCLAKSLLHNPKLLLLDEPASGLDPRARVEIRNILKNVAGFGTTILISSHILSDLENICSDIAIMERGKIVKRGKIADLIKDIQPKNIWQIEVASRTEKALEIIKALPFLESAAIEGKLITVVLDGGKIAGGSENEFSGRIVQSLIQEGIGIVSFQEKKASLEDAFMSYTKGLLA